MATKYVSALNGPQMDAALTDMAYHTSEAFAIGERNGVPVSSGDVAYHNNAKYYAEQASADATEADAAAARAEAAVPPSTAGAVFFDRAQALTDAQKGQAKANIGAGSTNRNLLDNAYFVGGGSQLGDGIFPINQRGQTSYSGSGTTIFDRWICDYNVTATLQSGGLRVQISALYSGLSQIIPAYKMKDGENYTFSIIVDGTLYSATFTAHGDGSWNNILFGNDWYVPYQFANGNWNFKALNAMNVDAFDHLVSAVKLEKGTVSTLANDDPPDFGEELRKCMRYLWYPVFYNNTTLAAGTTFGQISIFDIVTPVPMDRLPDIMLGGDWYVALNGTIHTITGVTVTFKSGNHLRVQCSTTDDLGSYNACSLLLGGYQGDNFNAEN